MMADDTVEGVLARFASGFPQSEMPASSVRHARWLLIDAVGCALAGDLARETSAVTEAAAATFGGGVSTVIGSQQQLSAAGATMLNAYRMTAMTVCDVYRPAHCHITPLVIPAALAASDEAAVSGRDFLAAVIVGMEMTTRIAVGLDYPAFRARGWHSPGVVGPLGSAAAVGRIGRFDEATMRHALGLAATQSAGSYLSWGTPAVKFHQARGAVSGLLAARLAEQGFPGGQQPLTAPDGGVYNTHSNGGDPVKALADLGVRWELEQIALRLWPGASPVQAMLTATFDMIASEGARADNVASVMVGVSTEDFATHARFARPRGTFEALLSYAYLCSAALHDQVVWFEQVEHPRFEDPTLLAFAEERISLAPVDDIPVNGCQLEVEFADGRRRSRRVEAARGTPENPPAEEEIRAKFHLCADRKLGHGRAHTLLETLTDIESCEDMALVCEMMRG
ncbi:MAG: MmgE/PrpD family protein [Acidimicrobiales bacterium]